MRHTSPTRVLLVRHADPEENAAGRCYGRLDVELSARGHRRARHLAGMLQRLPLAAVYTSPLRRATATARPIASAHDLELQELEAVREIDFGAFEGLTFDEIAEREPELFRSWMRDPHTTRFPGGESYATLRRRSRAAIVDLRRRHDGETIAVVSHGGVIRAVLADALDLPDSAIFRIDLRYGGVSIIDWHHDTPLIRLVNAPAVAVGTRRRGALPDSWPRLG